MQVRCPHCQNPLEVLDDSSLTDINCPSCDSRFNLLADDTLTRTSHRRSGKRTYSLKSLIRCGTCGAMMTPKSSYGHRRD